LPPFKRLAELLKSRRRPRPRLLPQQSERGKLMVRMRR